MKEAAQSRLPFWAFGLTVLLGLVGVTALFRAAQKPPTAEAGVMAQPSDFKPPTVTERQRLYLESEGNLSKLLFTLAFGSLGAILSFRLSDKGKVRLEGFAAHVACGLLLISIYSAFEFQVGIGQVLELPSERMFGSEGRVLRFPIICQFWSLFGAAALLAGSLFRGSGPKIWIAVVSSLLGLTTGSAAADAPRDSAPLRRCVDSWEQSRDLSLPERARTDAVELVTRLASRGELRLSGQQYCDFAFEMLDRVRSTAIEGGGASSGKPAGEAVGVVLKGIAKGGDGLTFSPGELVSDLIRLGEVWRSPAGILQIEGGGTSFTIIILDTVHPKQQWIRYTDCLIKLPVGEYSISASTGATLVSREIVRLQDGDRRQMAIRVKP